jgi:hypothetical protein
MLSSWPMRRTLLVVELGGRGLGEPHDVIEPQGGPAILRQVSQHFVVDPDREVGRHLLQFRAQAGPVARDKAQLEPVAHRKPFGIRGADALEVTQHLAGFTVEALVEEGLVFFDQYRIHGWRHRAAGSWARAAWRGTVREPRRDEGVSWGEI